MEQEGGIHRKLLLSFSTASGSTVSKDHFGDHERPSQVYRFRIRSSQLGSLRLSLDSDHGHALSVAGGAPLEAHGGV